MDKIKDEDKTKEQLIEELVDMRRRVAELEVSETEHQQAEQLLGALTNNSTVGIYIVRDRKFQFTNPQFQKYVGYNEDELLGMDSLSLVHPEDRDRVRENAVRVLRGESSSSYEFRYVTKGGEIMWVMEMVASIQHQGGKATLGFFMDITEEKQLAERLQELYEKETELRQELQAEIDRRVNFTRALVHELKTPLTPVMAGSEFLATRLQDEVSLRLARNINQSAYNINKMIDELLDVARGEMGMLQVELKSVDPLQLLRSVADEMTPMASKRGQSLVLNLPSSLPLIQADEGRLQQVVANLLTNASKFTPEGGRITLQAKRTDSALVVEVQDNGHGIAEEAQRRLFEPYYQVESGKGRTSGLGLGLALCKIFVELHGGRIWMESHVGKGSIFSFSVPLEAASELPEGSENE